MICVNAHLAGSEVNTKPLHSCQKTETFFLNSGVITLMFVQFLTNKTNWVFDLINDVK